MKRDVLSEINGKLIGKFSFLKNNFSLETQTEVISIIKEVHFSPGEIIFQENKIDDGSVYLIRKG